MDSADEKGIWPEVRALIEKLRTSRYWTDRRDACEQVGLLSRQLLFRLRQAAEDHDPDIVHCARKAMSQVRADASNVVGELVADMDRALAAGETHTTAADAASDAPDATAPPDGATFTPESLLEWLDQFATESRGHFKPRANGAQVELPTAADRCQNVFVDLAQKDDAGRPVALFYSICGHATPEAIAWAMETNTRLHRGAFGVINQGDRTALIMLLRHPVDRIWADDLPDTLRYLAEKADWAESKLSPTDRH
jgi:hypothetical protein